jgi:phosphoglycerol transferase MdoB-like AlkP superfamily enzyme
MEMQIPRGGATARLRVWIARVLVFSSLAVAALSFSTTFGINLRGEPFPTWLFVTLSALALPFLFLPFWVGVLLMVAGALLGNRRILWAARACSGPISALTIWLAAGYADAKHYPGAHLLAVGILLAAAATWTAPSQPWQPRHRLPGSGGER